MLVKIVDPKIAPTDAEKVLLNAVADEALLVARMNHLQAGVDKQISEALEKIEAENAAALQEIRLMKDTLEACTAEVDNLVVAAYAATGKVTFLGGLVTMQRQKYVPGYNRDADGEVWKWVKEKYPAYFVPNWTLVDSLLKANQDETAPIKGDTRLLPEKRNYEKLAANLLQEVEDNEPA